MIILGLTGSIGMGKSTTAAMFAQAGVPVNDADAVVHALYEGEAVAPIETAFPGTVRDGRVDRSLLSAQLSKNPALFQTLETIVHPLVRAREAAFIKHHQREDTPVVLLDIPLLFETGGEGRVDKTVVVTCDPDLQKDRVLSRPGMTLEKFELIRQRQMPDAEKRRRADFIIDTGLGFENARAQVANILAGLKPMKDQVNA
ncbi:dephospho-CoA kinase [Rhizobium sp. CFBP 8762]|uniref:dephospho-CoA kinase n=1 Tax=Rhizobium sp. CFBP 8762 TaxID=2775279 RepID=UPI00178293E7|nr:dephospho-CoA kinase [Rhizobium sp. CFBP 8762]MBD8556760.1 dephospho-CoA kinase [Rhizobium sp. CFBP 8762]